MATRNKIITNPKTGQSIRFIQTGADTNGSLLEMQSTFAPFSKEPPAHLHPGQEELFRVIKGSISVRINGQLRIIKEGQRFHVTRNTKHSMWNHTATTAVVNWKVWPAMTTEYFLETGIGLAEDGKVNGDGMPSFLQSILLLKKYSNEFRLARPRFALQKMIFFILSPLARLKGYKDLYPEYLD